MKPTSLILPMLGLAFALSGCGKSEEKEAKIGDDYKPQPVAELASIPYKPGEEELLLPLKVGNSWTYEVEENLRARNSQSPKVSRSELTLRCTNVVRIGEKVKGTIESVYQGRVNERQVWVMDKNGLFQTSVGEPAIAYNPPMPAFRSPLVQGATVQYKGRGFVADGTVTDFTATSTVEGEIGVDTSIGRVKAMAVTTTMKWPKGVSASTTWFAPKIGIVRWRQEVATNDAIAVQVMRLTKMDVK